MQELTPRELAIARLLGRNMTQVEIARQLKTTPRAVKSDLERIRVKLGVKRSRYIPGVLKDLGIID